MSDSVKKYCEMVEEGSIKPTVTGTTAWIYESPDGGKTIKKRKLHDNAVVKSKYTELELVEIVVKLARLHKELEPNLLLEIAKDELSVKKVCD